MLEWNSIDTVLFDMDGTVLDLHFDNLFWLEVLPRRGQEEDEGPVSCLLLEEKVPHLGENLPEKTAWASPSRWSSWATW